MRPFTRLLAFALGLAASSITAAQMYPAQPVSLIVPFAAGSGTDAIARVIAEKLGERLKQPVLVVNKPGASAQIGTSFVARSKADGYTLLMTTNTSHSANPSLYKSLDYDPIKDFTPITRVGEVAFAVAVNPSLPVRTMADLVAYAKANPGKLSYATPNSTSLVASETIKRLSNIDVVGIPYRASPQAMMDLLGGTVHIYVTDLASGMTMIKADKVRILGVTTARSNKLLPDVPPVSKTLPGFDMTSWNGIFAPAGVPATVVERLNADLLTVLADKAVQEKAAQLGYEIWPSRTPEDFRKYVADQLQHWTSLIKQSGIKPE